MSNASSDEDTSLGSDSDSEAFDELLGDDDREVINNHDGNVIQTRSRRSVQLYSPHVEPGATSLPRVIGTSAAGQAIGPSVNLKRPAPLEMSQRRSKLPKKGNVLDDFKCPITLELPVDPVMAIDSKIYEYEAITEHIRLAKTAGREVRSPWTRETMTSSDLFLVPSDWLSTLKKSVENGTFHGESVEIWKRGRKKKEEFEGLLKRAEGGDVKAMEKAGECYQTGEYNNPRDEDKAFKWYNRAYENHNSVIGMANVGDMMVFGRGTKKNVPKGQTLLFVAARKGSDYAAYALGK